MVPQPVGDRDSRTSETSEVNAGQGLHRDKRQLHMKHSGMCRKIFRSVV